MDLDVERLHPQPRPPQPRCARPAPTLLAARVLLACGDPCLGDTLEAVLKGHGEDLSPAGLSVRRVHDGLTCLQALHLAAPDLLILHASLDRMSGAEVLTAWRAAQPAARVPVLVLSSFFLADLTPELRSEEAIALPCDNLALVERATRLLLARA